ncbi:hypothetical protein ABQ284_12490 [Lentilactobacillus buchneri]|uniref:hypothetical protein n=1 Tax=Lentilactobacillus buchneri TaxID=1581 RepID=UPI0030F11B6F
MGERIIKSENRGFKGIWIPRDLWLNPKLSVMEMLFIAEIDSLEQDEQGCFASNNHFAEFFGVSRSRSSQIITGLIKKGFVTATYDRAETKQITKRHLWVVNKLTTPSKFIKQGYLENCEGSNTSYSNTKDNALLPKTSGSEVKDNFDKLWKLYPKKKGKAKAFLAYKRALKNGVTNKEIQDGIVKYLSEIKHLKTDEQYIKYGSTWFNNQAWDDDYQTPKPQSSKQSELDRVIAIQKREDLIYNKCSEFGSIEKALPVIQETYPDITWEKADRIFHPEKYLSKRGVENAN